MGHRQKVLGRSACRMRGTLKGEWRDTFEACRFEACDAGSFAYGWETWSFMVRGNTCASCIDAQSCGEEGKSLRAAS